MHRSKSKTKQHLARLTLLACLAVLATAAFGGSTAQAAAPLFDVKATWGDTNLPPGGEGQFVVQARNVGDASGAAQELTIKDELPAGVTVTKIFWGGPADGPFLTNLFCSGVGTGTAICKIPSALKSLVPGFTRPPGTKPGAIANVAPDGLPAADLRRRRRRPGCLGNRHQHGDDIGRRRPDVDQVPFSATPSQFDLVPGGYQADTFDGAYPFGSPSRQAGDHPFEQRVDFTLNAESRVSPQDGTRELRSNAALKTVEFTLPRGLVGNPETLPKCDPVDFASFGAVSNAAACPSNTQVGYLNIQIIEGGSHHGEGGTETREFELLTRVALYNLDPPKGTPVDLAFKAGGVVQAHIYATLDPAQNYAIKTVTPNISAFENVRGSEVTVWGVPGDPVHDKFRYFPQVNSEGAALGASFGAAPIRPFFTNPMDCGFDNGGGRMRIDSYQRPGDFTSVRGEPRCAPKRGRHAQAHGGHSGRR